MSAVFVYILQICKNFATIRNLEVELKNCTQDIKDLTGNDAMITLNYVKFYISAQLLRTARN